MPPGSAAQLLAQRYPPLQRYWPNLGRVSSPQAAFLVLDQLEALYGGAAGGGKSDALLAAALQYVDVPGYAALILRRTFKQLSLPGAIMARSKQWLAPYRAGREVHWNDDEKTWTFPSGATVTFGYLEHPDDIYRYQGPEFQYIGFDELTQFQQDQYTYLFSRLRRTTSVPVPVRMRSASNPGGVGHGWVKQRFPIEAGATPGQYDGRLFVPAKAADNPGLQADEYRQTLQHLPVVLQQQLLDGDWGVFEGAAYPMLNLDATVVPAFDLPAWERFESMDFGSTNPTAWLAWTVDYDGNLIVFDELYEPGLPSETAPRLLERRSWWHPDGESVVCYSDPTVFNSRSVTNRWGQPATVATEFNDHGIRLSPGNRDRVAGYVRVAQLARPDVERRFPDWHPAAGEFGSPRLFIFERCEHLIEQLQAAPLEELGEPHPGEAVSRKWEGPYGHAHAACRYGALSWARASARPVPVIEDPRAAFMAEVEARRKRDRHMAGGDYIAV